MGICCIAQEGVVDLPSPSWQNSDAYVRLKSDKEISHMAMHAHLVELEKRHRALEDEINEALMHPSADDLKIAELKRRKLLVKDEIARLQNEVGASVH